MVIPTVGNITGGWSGKLADTVLSLPKEGQKQATKAIL
jgi:hypothetical protein